MKREVVLVTGGNSGIGLECARQLARAMTGLAAGESPLLR